MKKNILPIFLLCNTTWSLFFSCAPELVLPEFVSDFEGNKYRTVQIGDQIWMAENLKTSKLNDGSPISLIIEDATWQNSVNPAYCWYNIDFVGYGNTYGALYNFFTVNTGKLCPQGWKVPSKEDWVELVILLGGDLTAGGKLKETGIAHWSDPNTGATNEVGFTALPGGFRDYREDYSFDQIGITGIWWSSDTTILGIQASQSVAIIMSFPPNYGLSVRCLKD